MERLIVSFLFVLFTLGSFSAYASGTNPAPDETKSETSEKDKH